MSKFFNDIQNTVQNNKILNKFRHFEKFYYNIKTIINSDEFKNNGCHHIRHKISDGFYFYRVLNEDNVVIRVKCQGSVTSISLNDYNYHEDCSL